MTDFSDFGGELHLDGKVMLFNGDSRDVLKGLPDASVDSVVTDPPYALVSIVKRFGAEGAAPTKDGDVYSRASAGFMGKQWDTGETAFAVTFWAEVMRVLKPGGHVIAASGTRTYHRLAVAIEDAGFEIRDCIMWVYASGFPKSHNIVKKLKDSGLACLCHKTIVSGHYVSDKNLRDLRLGLDANDALSGDAQHDVQSGVCGQTDFRKEGGRQEAPFATSGDGVGSMHSVRSNVLAECEAHGTGQAADVLEAMQRSCTGSGVGEARSQGASISQKETRHADGKKSSMEGRGDAQAGTRKLYGRSACESAGLGDPDVPEGRIHHGAPFGDGEGVRIPADADRGGSSQGPQSGKQSPGQLGVVADKRGPQAWGGWPVCNRCSKPVVPEGYGTALKPAVEPWVLARKPFKGTVAGNVLEHGTGAINVDGCRVGDEVRINPPGSINERVAMGGGWREDAGPTTAIGRFPANVIHDGSDEVVVGFPDTGPSKAGNRGKQHSGRHGGLADIGGNIKEGTDTIRGVDDNGGTAARFFYSAKADSLDRIGSKHPTVKPVDLMQYLCRLITPPGGIVLDPFAGSGSTGEAAWREGFRCILIEREVEYADDIRERMKLAPRSNAMKRKIIATKKAGDLPEDGLFSL